MKLNKIGIVGGTFNPVHIAHLIMADCFCDDMALNKCFFVPANISPFKTEEEEAKNISPCDRLQMVKLAANGNPLFDVDDFEINNPGVSFTYKTISHYKKEYPASEIYLMIGTDQAKYFREWRNWQDILKSIQICVAYRPGESEINKKEINAALTFENKKPKWIKAPALDISSTNIRERIKAGKSVRYQVPEKVLEYIRKKNIYI